jgi:hypothetical protein
MQPLRARVSMQCLGLRESEVIQLGIVRKSPDKSMGTEV